MTPPDDAQRTIGGLAGKAVGKVKEALGQATDSDELEREGRLQQAQAQAGLEAEEASRAAREREPADRSVSAAEDSRVRAAQEANRLEREAHEAERRADALDPTEEDS